MVNKRMSKSLHQHFFLVVKFTFTTTQKPKYSTKIASVFVYTLGVTISKFWNCRIYTICLFTGFYVQWQIDGLLDGFVATLVGTILRDYRHVYIHSYGESILHVMQGVLQQLMSVNEPKINWSLGTMKASFLSSCAHNRAFPYQQLEHEAFALV